MLGHPEFRRGECSGTACDPSTRRVKHKECCEFEIAGSSKPGWATWVLVPKTMSTKQPTKQNSKSNLTNWLKLPNKLSMAAQRKEEVLWNWGQPGLHSKTQSQTKAETRSTLQNLPIPPTVALPFAPKAFCKQSWFTPDHSVPVRAASFPFLL